MSEILMSFGVESVNNSLILQNSMNKKLRFKNALEQSKLGSLTDITYVAWCYQKGEGVGKDLYLSERYFKNAAEMGSEDAQIRLGLLYREGTGFKQDCKSTIYWLQQATENGSFEAPFWLANIYNAGDCVNRDYTRGYEYYMLAYRRGHVLSLYLASSMLIQKRLGWLMRFYGFLQLFKVGIEIYKALVNKDYAVALLHWEKDNGALTKIISRRVGK